MSAIFMLTFDCEGKWGVADRLNPRHRSDLSDERLRHAYRSIVDLLDEYRIEATFAFVGAFALSSAAFARLRPALEQFLATAPDYIGPALRDLDETSGDGWHGDQLLSLVKNARTTHEIALHGVTHVPWTSMDGSAVTGEMAMFEMLEGAVRSSRTFVYPRNLVAHTDELAKHGFAGFRVGGPKRSRARSLLAEFNIFERAERPLAPDRMVRIPAGFFLNWRYGLRALVPPAVTRMRVRRLLRRAAISREVVHYWLHPENLASAPATLSLLQMLVREVAEARESGHCQVVTQLGYCCAQESLR